MSKFKHFTPIAWWAALSWDAMENSDPILLLSKQNVITITFCYTFYFFLQLHYPCFRYVKFVSIFLLDEAAEGNQ